MFDYIKTLLRDDSGKPSLAKHILLFGFWFVMIYMFKLAVLHEVTIDYFIAFIGFISGHNLLSKLVDTKGNKTEVSTTDNKGQ